MLLEDTVWSEKWRPRKVKDCVLPADLKARFQEYVDAGEVPHLMLYGSPGVGKTTIARAMLDEIGADYKMINGSLEGRRIDVFQDIQDYASTVSFQGGKKYIILDEADYLNPNSVQPALRNFIQTYSKNCGFILTCNSPTKIIEALHSRCTPIDFKIRPKDKDLLMSRFATRVFKILKEEEIDFDKEAVLTLVAKYYPDWRRVLNELQRYAVGGKIDAGILTSFEEVSIKGLIQSMREKNFTKIRDWVGQNSDMEPSEFYDALYKSLPQFLTKAGIPKLVIILAKYMYESAFSANQEITMSACMAEIMFKCAEDWISEVKG